MDFPRPKIAAGTALDSKPPLIFAPFKIRDVSFQNRIWLSPMCQYSAPKGSMTDFHFVHLSAMLMRGPSLTIIEATAVVPEGRISPFDCGLWDDSQIIPISRMVQFAHSQNQKIGIQLAHAGRKASTKPPWQLSRGRKSEVANLNDGGWPDLVCGPDARPWGEGHATPKAMSQGDVQAVIDSFASAASRAISAGVDMMEIHGAHGYLLSSFLSATSNSRSDEYGGSFENRCRLSLSIVKAVRRVIPSGMPLSFRVSASEWIEPRDKDAWGVEETIELGRALHREGVDILVISSGGNSSKQKIPSDIDYQTNLAGQIRAGLRRRGCNLLVAGVGRIRDPKQAQTLLDSQSQDATCDLVLLGRQFLKEPSWVLRAAHELNVRVQWPLQYQLGRYGLETKL